jgi:hypothetical protein
MRNRENSSEKWKSRDRIAAELHYTSCIELSAQRARSALQERTIEHPDPARLAAFAQGALKDAELADIETHLAVCESCCELVCSLPEDEFVGRPRESQKSQVWSTAFQLVPALLRCRKRRLSQPD